MHIEAQGWRRNCGTRGLIEKDLSEVQVTAKVRSYDPNETYLTMDEYGDVLIEAKAVRLHLNGDYLVGLHLTQDDIIHLARLTFRGQDFEKVVAALSGRRMDA